MKTLILASAAVLTLGFGSAFAANTETVPQNQQQVAMNAQANGAQTGTYATHTYNVPPSNGYVGGWEPAPPGSNQEANGY